MDGDLLASRVAARLYGWRVTANKPLEDVAQLIGTTSSWMSTVERGQRQPSLDMVARVSVVTGIPVEVLVSPLPGEECGDGPADREQALSVLLSAVQTCVEQATSLARKAYEVGVMGRG